MLLLALLAAASTRRAMATCSGSTYSYGSSSCAGCPAGASFISASAGCAPAAPPVDTAFYLSGSATEGVAAFPSAPNVSYATGVFGAVSGALVLASGSNLYATPAAGTALLAALPAGNNAWSVSAWVQCAASLLPSPVSSTALLVWGAPYAALANSLALVLTGQPRACDGTWHHVAATHGDGGQNVTKAYFDGMAVASASQTLALPSDGTAMLVIGPSADVGAPGSYAFVGSPGSSACPLGVSSFVSSSLPCAPLTGPSDTSFYFSCDAAEGTGAYSVFNAPGISFVADHFGVAGRAMQLNGAYFSTPVSMLVSVGNAARSMTAFVKCAFAGTSVVLFWGSSSLSQSSALQMMNDRMRMFFYSNDVDYFGWSCDGQWHHWASTFDGSVAMLYVDGAEVASAVKSGVNTAANTKLYVGHGVSQTDSWTLNQNNAFDDIRVYNRALSAAEVAAISSGQPTSTSFAGSLADLRLYSRALSAVEVLLLSLPPLSTLVANAVSSPPFPVLQASAYTFSCAAGAAGDGGYLYKSAADGGWVWSGGAAPMCAPCAAGAWAPQGTTACTACPPGTYSLAGAASCRLCPAGTYGASAGLGTAACSGACANCEAGSTSPLPSINGGDSLACVAASTRAAPAALSLQLWPAAHPANPQHADLVVAPLIQCRQMTSAAACDAAASIAGADGVTRYVIGTAAGLHLEAAEALSCS
jgi:hypothetical protein